ncbi:MAG: lipase family protein [Acidimicrobiales bacterium]
MKRRTLIAVLAFALLAAACSSGGSGASSSGKSSGSESSSKPSEPGTIVADGPYPELKGTSNVDVHKIRYQSMADDGSSIEVTGTVIAPKGTPPAEGWPIIAWGHGTSGLADKCAPSATADLGGYAVGLIPIAESGYVIAATDYQGLGGPGGHPYLDGLSEGRAMIDSVRAARAVVPSASARWFSVGHSQGGHAALFAGELAPTYGTGLELVGVVGIAPASQLPLYTATVDTSAQGYLAMIAAGVVAADPKVKLADLLSPEALAQADVLESGCSSDINKVLGSVRPLLGADGVTQPDLVAYLKRSDPGHAVTAAPVLVVQGEADTTVLPPLTAALLINMCALGDTVELRTYPGAGHTDVILSALGDIRAFIASRLAGTPGLTTC